MRKSVFVALLVVFLPGIAFAVFQLFVFQTPVRERARVAAWAFLVIGLACVAALGALLVRDAARSVRRRSLGDSWAELSGRPPWLRWARKWGISAASLASGLVALFVFRRGVPDVAWLVGYLLLLWLLFAVFTQVRAPLETRGRRLVLGAVDYTIQTLYHNLLLFVLPSYYASATLTSVNVVFLEALVAAALLTAIDPWYRAVVGPRRWLNHALLAFSMFATLNVALPLVGVPPFWALEGSAALCALALTPALRQTAGSWKGAGVRAAVFAVAAIVLLPAFPAWVPPAPLNLARATLARDIGLLEPVGLVRSPISAANLEAFGGLVAYTAVYAPAGLKQPILHVWTKDGVPVSTVRLSPVRGGRAEGFRTYSRKSDFGPSPAGRWAVDVVTAQGQLIGRLSFVVLE